MKTYRPVILTGVIIAIWVVIGLLRAVSQGKRETTLNIRIVTDSTGSIPKEMCEKLGITVVSCTVHFGTEQFVDGVDPADEFYRRLAATTEQPTSSTPSPGAFLETYRQVADGASAIISIHMMESKSTVVNVARMAAGMLPDVPIHVIDCGTTTLGLGLVTVAAARAAQAGRALADVLAYVEGLVPKVSVHAAIHDLTQLRRSGRVSLGQALVAGVLGIKPILYIGQGVADVVDRVRGWSGALERMAQMATAKAGGVPVSLAVVHTNAEAEAHALLARIRSRFNAVETLVTEAGTALATHAGAGALGIVTIPAD